MMKSILGLSLAVAAVVCVQDDALAQSGSVRGTNTVDYLSRTSTAGERVTLRVSATGNGTNKLKVQVQYYNWGTNSWLVLKQLYVSPGSTSTTNYTVPNDPNHTEIVRYRLSRKIGTRRINYVVSEP